MGEDLTREQLAELGEELEADFRQEIGPHARAFPGVRRFIEECHAQGIAMAVASAAIAKNVNFLISALGLRDYFREVLTVDEISHPKPDPEIYLKTAGKLGVNPAACAVFEDSFVGIEAAKRAGMKCVAIASTFSAEDLRCETHADLIVPSFEAVSLQTLLPSLQWRGQFAWHARAKLIRPATAEGKVFGPACLPRQEPRTRNQLNRRPLLTLQPELKIGLPQSLFVGENSHHGEKNPRAAVHLGIRRVGRCPRRCSR